MKAAREELPRTCLEIWGGVFNFFFKFNRFLPAFTHFWWCATGGLRSLTAGGTKQDLFYEKESNLSPTHTTPSLSKIRAPEEDLVPSACISHTGPWRLGGEGGSTHSKQRRHPTYLKSSSSFLIVTADLGQRMLLAPIFETKAGSEVRSNINATGARLANGYSFSSLSSLARC